MAQHYDDCTTLTNWTEAGIQAGDQFAIWNDTVVFGKDVIRRNNTTSFERLWFLPGTFGNDQEVYTEWYYPNLGGTYRECCVLRSNGGSQQCYSVRISEITVRIVFLTGSSTASTIVQQSYTLDPFDFIKVRFRVEGSTLKLKVWSNRVAEPASWTAEGTDTTYSTGDTLGLYGSQSNVYNYWSAFGAADGGATAPTAPLSGGTTYQQSVAGVVSLSGGILRLPRKSILASIDPAGGVLKLTSTSPKQGSITPSGAVSFGTALSQLVEGSITLSGTLKRKTAKGLLATIEATGALTKKTSRILSGSMTAIGSVFKKATRRLSGAISPSGNSDPAVTLPQAVSGSITALGGLLTNKFTIVVSELARAARGLYSYITRR